MIVYYKLFDMLRRKNLTIEKMRISIGASSATMTKMRNNQIVSLDVIDRICDYLDCQPGDIMEHQKSLKN